MAEPKTNVELLKLDVEAGTPISVDMSVFNTEQIAVYLTDARVLAVPVTDYGVDYLSGSTTFRDGFKLTLTASAIDKIEDTDLPNLIYVRRHTELTTEFSATDAFLRDRIVDEFDKNIMRAQEAASDVASAVRAPAGDTGLVLPSAAQRAGNVLEFDAEGKPVATSPLGGLRDDVAQVAIDRAAVAVDRAAVAADKVEVSLMADAVSVAKGAVDTAKGQVDSAAAQVAADKGTVAADKATVASDKTAAQTAKTAAETAQGGAQTARTGAETARTQSQDARDLSVTARNEAQTARSEAVSAVAAARALYQGALAADPTLDLGGAALTNKAYYFNTTSNKFRFYTGSAWSDNPVTAGGGASAQVRLVCVSGTTIRLEPYGGNNLFLSGAYRTLADAGVTLSNTGAANGLNHIYAYWTGSAIALERSLTGTQMSGGVLIKSGDATRLYVGSTWHTSAGSVFQDSRANRLVRSHYNEKALFCGASNVAEIPVTSTAAYVEVDATMRNYFLAFAGESIRAHAQASVRNATVNTVCKIGVTYNAADAVVMAPQTIQVPVAALYNAAAVEAIVDIAATGLHYVNLAGIVGGSTGTFANNAITSTLMRA